MKEKELIELDVKMQKVLKRFPKNDSDCFMYLRGNHENNGHTFNSTIYADGTRNNIMNLFLAYMEEQPEFVNIMEDVLREYKTQSLGKWNNSTKRSNN